MMRRAVVVALAIAAATACSTDFSVETPGSDSVAVDGGAAGATPAPSGAPTAEPSVEPAPTVAPTAVAAQTPEPTVTPEPPRTPEPTPAPTPTTAPAWTLTVAEIDDEIRARIEPTSWRPGCPVGLDGLRLLTFPYVTFDGDVATGELIVAAEVAEQIGEVFRQLFEAEYPIQRIDLVDTYGGDDLASMQANNTSAFNCREVAGKPGIWSNHALGLAIDLNPLMNPYVSGGFVDPPDGVEYLDRSDVRLGMIVADDPAVQAFLAMGWRWGGNWVGLKDYQHFSHNGR